MVAPSTRVTIPKEAPHSRSPCAAKHPRACQARQATSVCRVLALDCEVVGTIADGSAVLEAAQRLEPDVIVVDLNLPHVHGLEDHHTPV